MTEAPWPATEHVLIFGLSANPVHQGHIDVLTGVLTGLRELGYKIEAALILPVYRRNPTGTRKDTLPETYEQRVAMCELAAQEVNRVQTAVPVKVSRIEAQLVQCGTSPNYTAETLTYLKKHELTGKALMFVVSSQLLYGADPEFSHWHQVETILHAATLVVCPRPGFPINQDYIQTLYARGGKVIVLRDVKTRDISSTQVRQRLAQGENPLTLAEEGVMPTSIAHYLVKHNMYQDASGHKKGLYHH